MAVNPASDRLPCGRRIDQLWNHIADGTDSEHARGCEHCQAALTEIRPLTAVTGELAAEPVTVPDDLSGRVMAVIRAWTHYGPRIPLTSQAGMGLEISEPAAAMVLRAAGDTVDGVRARSCRLTPVGSGRNAAAGLQLTISLRYGMPARATAMAVRAAVRAAAARQLGLSLGSIDIELADIHFA